ncbi:MAG: amidohydrolase family protein [Gammaproteobacteria bacterium]|nr:amidohydrolase family protein [Gammaproteobacteria bacterium]
MCEYPKESRVKYLTIVLAGLIAAVIVLPAAAQNEEAQQTLITNVNVWNGSSDKAAGDQQVLIEGNLVKAVGKNLQAAGNATVINGGGRTLIPGLIDMHSHLSIMEGMLEGRDAYDQMAIGAMTANVMQSYLDQGFTSTMDLGGNMLGVTKAVNQGRVPGPRIFPSGGFLSQTGGHGDTGRFNDELGATNRLEEVDFAHIVDGRAEVMKAARHNFRAGATQIKIMGGGGVASEFDPLHTTQFTLDEMKAAVEIAEDYGSFVTVHAYHDKSVNRAIDAGVRLIQHNFLVSEDTIKRMKKEGVALSLQGWVALVQFGNVDEITFFSPDQKAKGTAVNKGAAQMIEWARKHDVLIVSGGDMFGANNAPMQAENLIILESVGFTPLEILKTATSNAAIVLGWTGEMNQYKYGTLGVIEEGAYADMVLVDGNPLEDITLLRDYDSNFKLIMKDGEIWKNTLD